MSSSATTALSRRPLREVLEGVADPRDRRGVRHALTAVLCLAVVGVLAGCRTLGAMREHVADLEPADPGALGLEEGRALPSESTIRRVLERVNADDLDARVSSWLRTRVGAIGGRRVIAVDGKTMRGARGAGERAPHLPAAPGRAGGVVVGQRRVADKSNEIPALRDLLAPLDLDGAVITADAMHTQRGTAEWIISRGAHYVLTVKGNQPGLKRELERPPWKDVPAVSVPDGSHGRRVRRTIKAVEAPARVDLAGAAQVIRIRRTRTVRGRKHVEVVHPVLLPSHDRRPARTGRLLGPRALGHREPPPLDPRRGLRRGPPPAAHRQRTTGHGRPAKPRHQPHPPGPRPRGLHRRHHQGHGPTPPTSHRPDHPPTPINRLCRDPDPLLRPFSSTTLLHPLLRPSFSYNEGSRGVAEGKRRSGRPDVGPEDHSGCARVRFPGAMRRV